MLSLKELHIRRRAAKDDPEQYEKVRLAIEQIHRNIASSHPKLARGQVWCRHCGSTMRVDSAGAMRGGWPKCCGYTMTIDAPDER